MQITSGLYYFLENTNEDSFTLTGTGDFSSQSFAATETTSKSVYVQGIYAITDSLGLVLGGRYTKDQRDMPGTYDFAPYDFSESQSKFNYLVSLNYQIDEDKMVYASTATGYRAGGAGIAPDPEHFSVGGSTGLWKTIDPETVKNYEIGIKTEWLDKKLRVNAAGYYQDYKDYQSASISLLPGGSGALVRGYDNYDVTIKGGELEVSAAPTNDIRLGGSFGYTSAYTDSDLQLPNIPKKSWSLFATKDFDFDMGTLQIRADYSVQDEFFTQLKSPEASTIDKLSLLNVGATFEMEQWKFSGYVKNATNEKYYTYTNYLFIDAFNLAVLNAAALGMPRTLGVSAQYNF